MSLLKESVQLQSGKIVSGRDRFTGSGPVLVLLAAGKGTRFGKDPKCIQPVLGRPLARYSIDAFRRLGFARVIALVGYRQEEVCTALGDDNLYVRSEQQAGGTAFAAYEAFSVPELSAENPLVLLSMGDRIVPTSVFRRLWETHIAGDHEADLTFLTAHYEPPKNRGKGRVLRDEFNRVVQLIEEQDIAQIPDLLTRRALHSLTEGNCPLYALRARTLLRCLEGLTNRNAQGQFYLTDIIERLASEGAEIRTITTNPAQPEYDLLCSDVTQPRDLALLEGILSHRIELVTDENEVERAAAALRQGRPSGQVASIIRQLRKLSEANLRGKLGLQADRPFALGIAGGRLRLAFMHPDMARFYGPAWQMPIGAGDAQGGEQVVMLAQSSANRRIHLHPLDPRFRESIDSISADEEAMYPGVEIADWHTYEKFGTHMSETLLLSLGYFSDEEIERRRQHHLPTPPSARGVSNNLRRPFALVGNSLASLRTLREGHLGAKVQAALGRGNFTGLRLLCTGDIPQGGFSSSSAVTVATKNALNSLYDLGLPPNLLVHLACQAEYGTGVRAGSLDQATEQKGIAGQGTLLSSNPADNYCILGTYPVPVDRFRVIFPYSVERDRATWRWSGGSYGESVNSVSLTSGEMRKLTGKAAEIAALLVRLPLDTDFFREIEADLLADGRLGMASRRRVAEVLLQLPVRIGRDALRSRVEAQLAWYAEQLAAMKKLPLDDAQKQAAAMGESLLAGWREPVLRRTDPTTGQVVSETGVPLRAIIAYLYGEVAVNFHLIHQPEAWIGTVTRSQGGDRAWSIAAGRLPGRAELEGTLPWEAGLTGPELLDRWLDRVGALPYDYYVGLDEETLAAGYDPWRATGNFFRGLALIDLAEAMLKRAFGEDTVAVRVNAAGQGDYFQVHIDTQRADPADVQTFLRAAFYRRFGLNPEPEFVQPHPGAGAVGVRLSRYDLLPLLIEELERDDQSPARRPIDPGTKSLKRVL